MFVQMIPTLADTSMGGYCITAWDWLNTHTKADGAMIVIAFVVGALVLKLAAERIAGFHLPLANAFQLSFNTLPCTLVFGMLTAILTSFVYQAIYDDVDTANAVGPCVGLAAGYTLGWLIACTTVLGPPDGRPTKLGPRLLAGLLAWAATGFACILFLLPVSLVGQSLADFVNDHGLEPYLWLVLFAAFWSFIYAAFLRASTRWITGVRLLYSRALVISLLVMGAFLLARILMLATLGNADAPAHTAITMAGTFMLTFLAASFSGGFLIPRAPQAGLAAASTQPSSAPPIGPARGAAVGLVSVAILFMALFAADNILPLFTSI